MAQARTTRGSVRLATRVVLWALWGAALLVVPAVSEWAGNVARVPAGWEVPDAWFYLTRPTSAAALSLVAMALAYALRSRLRPHARALALASLAAAAAYLGCTLFNDLRPLGELTWLAGALGWLERPLRWVAWPLWGALLVPWALPEEGSREEGAAASPLDGLPGADDLTAREREVAELIVSGSTQAQAAEALGISASSVSTYRPRACEKLGLASLDELAGPVRGAAAPPRPIGVTTPGALPLMGLALFGALTLRFLGGLALISGTDRLAGTAFVAAVLGGPWAVLLAYARWRGMRVRPRELDRELVLVMVALAAFGLLVGRGVEPLVLPVGNSLVSVPALAGVAHAGCVAALAPHLLWPRVREERVLDVERCVLYLRGRGAGELQARVLTEIALGRSAPEVCEDLHVARGTVNAYRAQGYELLGVHTSRELEALLARDVGYVPSAGKNRPPADGEKNAE